MDPTPEPLRMYGAPSEVERLPWSWARDRLVEAATYWVAANAEPGHPWPHPRPVWGVWAGDELHLSVGSPVVRRALAADPHVTVHLDSGIETVIVEGAASVASPDETRRRVADYDAKYDWRYDLEQYGPFTRVAPRAVMAWRLAGVAGRDGFQQVGRWTFG